MVYFKFANRAPLHTLADVLWSLLRLHAIEPPPRNFQQWGEGTTGIGLRAKALSRMLKLTPYCLSWLFGAFWPKTWKDRSETHSHTLCRSQRLLERRRLSSGREKTWKAATSWCRKRAEFPRPGAWAAPEVPEVLNPEGRRSPGREGSYGVPSEVPKLATGTLCHPRGGWAALSTAWQREGACLGKHAPKRGAL